MMVSTEVQKVIINFGYFLKRICHQDFLNNRPIWSHWLLLWTGSRNLGLRKTKIIFLRKSLKKSRQFDGSGVCSVVTCGWAPVWPDLAKFLPLWLILKFLVFIGILQNFVSTLANFWCYWAHYNCCKWPYTYLTNYIADWSHCLGRTNKNVEKDILKNLFRFQIKCQAKSPTSLLWNWKSQSDI